MAHTVKYGSDGKGQIHPILTISNNEINNENRDSRIIRRDGLYLAGLNHLKTSLDLIRAKKIFKIIMAYSKVFFKKFLTCYSLLVE